MGGTPDVLPKLPAGHIADLGFAREGLCHLIALQKRERSRASHHRTQGSSGGLVLLCRGHWTLEAHQHVRPTCCRGTLLCPLSRGVMARTALTSPVSCCSASSPQAQPAGQQVRLSLGSRQQHVMLQLPNQGPTGWAESGSAGSNVWCALGAAL